MPRKFTSLSNIFRWWYSGQLKFYRITNGSFTIFKHPLHPPACERPYVIFCVLHFFQYFTISIELIDVVIYYFPIHDSFDIALSTSQSPKAACFGLSFTKKFENSVFCLAVGNIFIMGDQLA